MKKIKKTQLKREVRVYTAPQKFEIRRNADGSRSISGYAATFGDLSENLGGFKEVIRAGAFKQSLIDNPDVLCLYGHDHNQILGRVSSGTLTIAEDPRGLRFSCKLPDTSTARDLIALMERGDIGKMSFGFGLSDDGDSWEEVGGQIIRTLTQVILWEISVVGQPAYKSSSVNLRSCPAQLRKKLKRDNDESDDNEDPEDDKEDQEERCECDCEACEEGDCDACTNPDCDDDDCEDCPAQTTRAAHHALLTRRLRA
jgi:HK97 family phage prohead protease